MTFADKLVRSVSPLWDSVHSGEWTILGEGELAGEKFRAEGQTSDPIVLDTSLQDQDGREKTMLYVRRPAPSLTAEMVIFGYGSRWVVVFVDDNPINERVKFEIVKMESEKDQ